MPRLSRRGEAHAAAAGVTPTWASFDNLLQNPYHVAATSTDDGVPQDDLMMNYYEKNLRVSSPADQGALGSHRLLDALCSLYNSSYWAPAQFVEPQHVIPTPERGTSLLKQLAEHLADPNESFLCAAPYLRSLDADLATHANVRCRPVLSQLEPQGSEEWAFRGSQAVQGFQQALDVARRQGTPVRAVLLHQPCSAVGRCYDKAALLEFGRFCEKHDLFLISDESHALTVFPTSDEPSPTPFVSALSINWRREANVDPSRIVAIGSVWADTEVNSARLHTLICQQNEPLVRAVRMTAKAATLTPREDATWSTLLLDKSFLPRFLESNQQRLSAAYEACKAWCRRQGIAYVACNAGPYLLVDLTRFLPTTQHGAALSSEDGETALWAEIVKNGVPMLPSFDMHFPKPGTFRLTFALPPPDLNATLAQLERALSPRP